MDPWPKQTGPGPLGRLHGIFSPAFLTVWAWAASLNLPATKQDVRDQAPLQRALPERTASPAEAAQLSGPKGVQVPSRFACSPHLEQNLERSEAVSRGGRRSGPPLLGSRVLDEAQDFPWLRCSPTSIAMPSRRPSGQFALRRNSRAGTTTSMMLGREKPNPNPDRLDRALLQKSLLKPPGLAYGLISPLRSGGQQRCGV